MISQDIPESLYVGLDAETGASQFKDQKVNEYFLINLTPTVGIAPLFVAYHIILTPEISKLLSFLEWPWITRAQYYRL